MKNLKSIFCVLLLSTCLVANAFAGNTTGNRLFDFFDNVVNAVVLFAASADDCPTRQCQDCRPTEDGGDGTCRPTPN